MLSIEQIIEYTRTLQSMSEFDPTWQVSTTFKKDYKAIKKHMTSAIRKVFSSKVINESDLDSSSESETETESDSESTTEKTSEAKTSEENATNTKGYSGIDVDAYLQRIQQPSKVRDEISQTLCKTYMLMLETILETTQLPKDLVKKFRAFFDGLIEINKLQQQVIAKQAVTLQSYENTRRNAAKANNNNREMQGENKALKERTERLNTLVESLLIQQGQILSLQTLCSELKKQSQNPMQTINSMISVIDSLNVYTPPKPKQIESRSKKAREHVKDESDTESDDVQSENEEATKDPKVTRFPGETPKKKSTEPVEEHTKNYSPKKFKPEPSSSSNKTNEETKVSKKQESHDCDDVDASSDESSDESPKLKCKRS